METPITTMLVMSTFRGMSNWMKVPFEAITSG